MSGGAADPGTLSGRPVVGVTGHLILPDAERRLVELEAGQRLERLLDAAPTIEGLRLVSGLAPGADLVLTDVILSICQRRKLSCHLTAALVGTPAQMIGDWRRRAKALGVPISPKVQRRVEGRFERLLARADQRLQFIAPTDAPERGFQQLAALLAESAQILFAVLREHHPGQPGGAAQVVSWWQNPGRIPPALSLGLQVGERQGRRLILIDPHRGETAMATSELLETSRQTIEEIRAHLRAGNALSANDLAARALDQGADSPMLRYLYLLSLAASGNPRRALLRYEALAPPEELRDEDWRALRGRLHKDLAFLGEAPQENLRLAAEHYAGAWNRFSGIFAGINAATTYLLSGQQPRARRLARAVRTLTERPAPADERARYYHWVSAAEAKAVLGDLDGCRAELSAADPLLRGDLVTRGRTRAQLRRVLEARGDDPSVLDALAMPMVYLLAPSTRAYPDAVGPELAARLRDSPVYALLGAEGDRAAVPVGVLVMLLDAGVRLHLLDLRTERALPEALVGRVESVTRCRGFLERERGWLQAHAQRQLFGLAQLNARALDVPLRRLRAIGARNARHWTFDVPAAPQRLRGLGARRMVGLVFSDMVGFAGLDDPEIQQYWSQVVPALARSLAPLRRQILLQQTWGDALHLVTADAHSAAVATEALLATVRALRARLQGRLAGLEIRVGAHFAPAWHGTDAIERIRTFYGTQLSFTARVEPVTPPGTTYVTEAFAAELAVTAADEFQVEYAGEIALAKRFGNFRIYSLRRVAANLAI
jgi:hypothetical protein